MPLNVNAASFNPGAAEFIPSSFMPIAVTGSENGKLSQGESSTRDQANVTPEPTRTHAGNGVNGTAQGNGVCLISFCIETSLYHFWQVLG